MSQLDWHLTTEQLSASLDRQISNEEEIEYTTHIMTCEQCQQELAGLRQTVVLLHALPSPALPRSFALPATTTLAPLLMQKENKPARAERKTYASPYVHNFLRFTSAIAAVAGLLFILSGLLMALPTYTTNSAATGTAIHAPQSATDGAITPVFRSTTTTAVSNTNTPHVAACTDTNQPQPTACSTAEPAGKTAAVTPPQTHIEKQTQKTVTNNVGTAPRAPTFLFFNLSTQGGRMGLGIFLCLAGSIGFTIFSRHKKQLAEM